MLTCDPLFREILGCGEDIVLLHGWGMSSRFMQPFAERLSERFRITLIDLPGHGRSGLLDDSGIASVAAAVLARAPARAHWVGWSLGGLIALQVAALSPMAVRSLCFLAGSPRFVAAPDWPGVDESVLNRFASDLHRDYGRTIDRFLALQLHGMRDERPLLKALRETLGGQAMPAEAGLAAGLSILRETDLRGAVSALHCPLLMLLGRRDRLIPPAVGPAVLALNHGAAIATLEDAAHIPFWTHSDATLSAVTTFLERGVSTDG